METEKDIPLQEGLRKRASNNLTRSESSGSTIDSSIRSCSDRADDGKFDGNVGKEKATYGITAMVHMKLKESPLSSDAIFKQITLPLFPFCVFLVEKAAVHIHISEWITLPLFPFCAFVDEKAAVHTHISELVHSRDGSPFNQIAQNQCSLPFKPGNGRFQPFSYL